jgi:regulator of sirC expression with transglutaminase-like and TPR domain
MCRPNSILDQPFFLGTAPKNDKMRILTIVLSIFYFFVATALPGLARPSAIPQADPIKVTQSILAVPENEIDFAKTKLVIDKLINPRVDVESTLRQIDTMVRRIKEMAGPNASMIQRLAAVRRYIYVSGDWNGYNPFQYDLSDPLGSKMANKLLTTYLATHRGNCVSMPILFVALAQRLGLNATLSTAPNHMFVKYIDDVTGKVINLETTSGAYPSRDVWIRQIMPMTDEAIANGIYMKTLSKKETLAVMADIVLEHEFLEKRYQEAWDVAEVLRPYYPNNLAVLLVPTNAALGLIQEEYLEKYPKKNDIPPKLMDRFSYLENVVPGALNHAYALGWREIDGTPPSKGQ